MTQKTRTTDADPAQFSNVPLPKVLSQDTLFKELWGAADILRGSIDSSDYKNYIFTFLFLKRLSDVFEEERQKILAEGRSEEEAEDPDEHRFFVPKEARWPYLLTFSENLGGVLNKAAHALAAANPSTMESVLNLTDFNDERKLGGQATLNSTLLKLVHHFSRLPLGNDNLSERDLMGRAYEYLIEKFADDAGKKGGEFYTPKTVVELLVELLDPQPGMRISDPTCGSGGMLIASAHHVEQQMQGKRERGQPLDLSLYGQEKNANTWAIAKMNMLLHDYPDAQIHHGDTIADPGFKDKHGNLQEFDIVIANPPFSLDKWMPDKMTPESDPFRRFKYGMPPASKGDLAFIQHMVATLAEGGRAGVVTAHGVLFRGGKEQTIRTGLVKSDLLDAVIGLPANMFYGTGIPAAILIFNRAKPAERRGKVMIIDASREFQPGKKQNKLQDAHIATTVKLYREFADVEGLARVVSLAEIAENEYNLNISRYVAQASVEEVVDLKQTVQKLRELEQQRQAAQTKVNEYLKVLGIDV